MLFLDVVDRLGDGLGVLFNAERRLFDGRGFGVANDKDGLVDVMDDFAVLVDGLRPPDDFLFVLVDDRVFRRGVVDRQGSWLADHAILRPA